MKNIAAVVVVGINIEYTRVRVVFDASQKTSSGLSSNDCLHVGPDDLRSIALR